MLLSQTLDKQEEVRGDVTDIFGRVRVTKGQSLLGVENVTSDFYPYLTLASTSEVTDNNPHAQVLRKIFDDEALPEQEVLEYYLAQEFSDIEEVDSIYVDGVQDEVIVTVLLSNQKYDDSLMDALLDRELNILCKFQDLVPDFRYVPLLNRERDECVTENARLVYMNNS